jgi:hypothetical protein
MKWICEIVRDFDGTYYANMTDENGYVSGLPEYVNYKTLIDGVEEKTGRCLPLCKHLKFKNIGRKGYAIIQACFPHPEGSCISYTGENIELLYQATKEWGK